MKQDQKDAIAELFSALERAKNEGLVIVFDNTTVHVADYEALGANGFFEGADENGMNADEMALKKTPHESLELIPVTVLDKWIFGEVSE